MFCARCGKEIADSSVMCEFCGNPVGGNQVNSGQQPSQKSKMAAGLLGIFLGAYGVHNFYLGNTNRGILQLVLTFCTCGIAAIWGFIEGILILTGSINTDANGVPLKD